MLYETRLRSDEDNLVYEPGLLERTSNLGAMASSMPARPTNQMVEVFSDFAPHIGQEITDLNNSLKTDLPHRRFFTMSAWADEASLRRFTGTEPHRSVMRRLQDRMGETRFKQLSAPGTVVPPRWHDALVEPAPFLAELARRGVKAAAFEGVTAA